MIFVAGLSALAAGCATSRGEYAEPAGVPLVLSDAVTDEAYGAKVRPAVLVEQGTLPGEPASATAMVAPQPLPAELNTASTGEPSDEPKAKLLTPEEKERVVAELEALARSQQAGAPPAELECDEQAPLALDPEERLKRDSAGLGC